ncbi:hypothetical protein QYF36_006454 [Acer negundo]|nr:hypothetical protein QYF36_006454 [Acer negundo]
MSSDDSVEITGFTAPNSPSNSLKDKAFDKCRSSSKVHTVPSHGKCGASFETPKFKHPNNPYSSTQNELEEKNTKCYVSALPRKRSLMDVERERAFNAARVFEPVNPFCRVVLQPSYLYKKGCTMYFPSYFAKRHLMGVSEFIKLQTSDGKQRSARCVYRGDSAKLVQGWYEFTLENNLGEGDVCVFEVLRSSDIVLKVTVFRVLESDGQSKRCKIEVLDEKYNGTKVGSTGAKRKVRGKARGVAYGAHDLEVNIYQGRIVTPVAVREISIIFYQNIIGPWIKYKEYPDEEQEALFARFKQIQCFHYTYRIAHPPDNVSPVVWKEMVDKWMDAKCQNKSKKSPNSQKSVQMCHTAGSVSFAKYKYEQVKQTGVEPNPIDSFKKFNMSKTKDGEAKWSKEAAANQDYKVDDWDIYLEVVGEASHGHVVGLGRGMKPEDVFGPGGSRKS